MTRCLVAFFDLHAQSWRDACDGHISRSFWPCLHVRDLTLCMLQSERDALTIDLYLASALSCIRDYTLSPDEMPWQRPIPRSSQYFLWPHALRCFSPKCSAKCVPHRKPGQKLSHTDDVPSMTSVRPTILPYWLQDAFIEVLGQGLSILSTPLYNFYSAYNTFVLTPRCLHRDIRPGVVPHGWRPLFLCET